MTSSHCSISFVHMNVHQVLPWEIQSDRSELWLAVVNAGRRPGNAFRGTKFENPLFGREAVAGARPHKPSLLSSCHWNGGGRLTAAVPLTSVWMAGTRRDDPCSRELANSSKLESFLLKSLPQMSFSGTLQAPFMCPFLTAYIHRFPQWGVFSCFALQSS